ncbi:uncharacterized protein B0H18DRAFT_559412 [Fomitopsis serialis]|uniref:uncharacterized protein n=1 Tax=Fomitopsis serialis TaxID=139415 RepID=UPI002007F950|nr:uncharacterized protein B0H18DRAFT_559412 [Neoantrodia serialis]KAH9921406.1 hypothetical protein B0H18DRAFT_559412 [Neoantrodia serialis]
MAPKAPRKASVSGRDSASSTGGPKAPQNTSMPPPPDPVAPKGILEPEVDALSNCLRSAVVKTGQVYGFYADAKKLGIQRYASRPPRSLTASLGREVEKYDQLCDAIESQLQRAIAVLQRDIRREEQRLKAEAEADAAAAEAAKAAAAAEASTSSSSPMVSPTSPSLSNPFTGQPLESSPDSAGPKPLPTPARRQSTVSLSSLQRPNFQHKLDLSGTSMRMNPDELLAGIPSGLSSPVTLAPKSQHRAIPQELVMAALTEAANRPVDIDLTVDPEMEMHQATGVATSVSLDPTAGTSADKPIELDLDMDIELFSAAADAAAGNGNSHMFSQHGRQSVGSGPANMAPDVKPKQEEEDFFSDALNASNASGDMGDILASLGGPSNQGGQPNSIGDASHPRSTAMKAPSPGSILATFNAAQQHPGGPSGHSNDAQFDLNSIDLSSFSADMFGEHHQEPTMSMSEVENLFNIDSLAGENKGGTAP